VRRHQYQVNVRFFDVAHNLFRRPACTQGMVNKPAGKRIRSECPELLQKLFRQIGEWRLLFRSRHFQNMHQCQLRLKSRRRGGHKWD